MENEFEEERLRALAAREEEEAGEPEYRRLAVRFGPGSFGCHEAVHMTQAVVALIQRELVEHSAVLQDADWYRQVREAQELLHGAYQRAAEKHFEPAADGARLTIVQKNLD